jgi:hypothetical protein
VILSVSLLAVLVAGVWYENYGETPRYGLIPENQIIICGITGAHSYRSDYKISYCLKNDSKIATSKRIELKVIALDCLAKPCSEVETKLKEVYFDIEPEQEYKGELNLAFNSLNQDQQNIEWKLEVIGVKAVK